MGVRQVMGRRAGEAGKGTHTTRELLKGAAASQLWPTIAMGKQGFIN